MKTGKSAAVVVIVCLLLGAAAPPKAAPASRSTVDDRLRQAFPAADFSNAAIKLDLPSSGLLIAAEELSLAADGRVKLSRCAIARFVRVGTLPLTAVRSEWAYVKLDGPVSTIWDLGKRKIVSVELAGGVRLSFEE